MAKMKLTAAGVRALSTEKSQEDFWDTLTPGLSIRVSGRTGRKTWYVRYRVGANGGGKHRRMKLGRYPALSLADARERARNVFAKAAAGEDPARKREKEKEAEKRTSFEDLAREVLEAKKPGTRESTQQERARMLETYLLPEWEGRPAGEVSRRDVRMLVEGIANDGAPVMANRVLSFVKTLFNAGLDREFPGVEANPAHRLKPVREEKRRRRYLDRNEIRTVWQATEPENPVTKAIFRLTLLTAQRVGSVCALRWSDIDEADVWTIPADQFKGKRRHAVPLSAEARAVLGAVREVTGDGEYAFPGRVDGSEPHITSTNNALRRIRKRTGLPRWTLHDMRRTFRTHATRSGDPSHPKDPVGLGVAPHVADAVLGHKEASLGRDRYTAEPERYLLSEKREALTRWGAFVQEAVEGGP